MKLHNEVVSPKNCVRLNYQNITSYWQMVPDRSYSRAALW